MRSDVKRYATCEGTDNLVPDEGAWYNEDSGENRNQEVRT